MNLERVTFMPTPVTESNSPLRDNALAQVCSSISDTMHRGEVHIIRMQIGLLDQ